MFEFMFINPNVTAAGTRPDLNHGDVASAYQTLQCGEADSQFLGCIRKGQHSLMFREFARVPGTGAQTIY